MVVSLLLGGCATLAPPTSEPAPTPEEAPALDSAAVVRDLQSQALAQQAAGQSGAAAGLLERALRIDADNAGIYRQIAEVRLSQGRFAEAEQVALKGLSVVDDAALPAADLWRLVAQARSARGDTAGARQARDQACALAPC